MRILGKAFITEKVENTQVEELRIAGVSEGIARMQSDPEAQSGASSFDAVQTGSHMSDEANFDE